MRHVHDDRLRGRLGLVRLAVAGLAIRLLVATVGLLWLLRIVTALAGRRAYKYDMIFLSTFASAAEREVPAQTLRRIVLALLGGAAAVIVLGRHDG